MLNVCFLTFVENIKIQNKPPWIYLEEFKQNKNFGRVLRSHALPHKYCLLARGDVYEKYESFKRERISLIKKDLTTLIGKKYIID